MTRRIIIKSRASQDLDDHFSYLAENDFEVALQFFDAARSTIAQLAKLPRMGSPYLTENFRLQGLRKWAVKGFRNYLIFYFDDGSEIEVLRILYATQNLSSILENEPL